MVCSRTAFSGIAQHREERGVDGKRCLSGYFALLLKVVLSLTGIPF